MAIGASDLIRGKCKRHAITGKTSLNWSSAVEQTENNFSTKKETRAMIAKMPAERSLVAVAALSDEATERSENCGARR
jgi:hypothetical protein